MVTKEDARGRVAQLVKEFSDYTKEQLDKKSEIQIQYEFIDELFKALGWDMRKDVEREERVLKGRADYIFRIGNQESLVVEAKKTSVRLEEEQGRQAVSYAYHRKIKFSVLTNFKYIRVYHALSHTKNIDRNLLFWLEFKDFEKEFDKLWLLSKKSIEGEEIAKLIPSKDQRTFKPIDESILDDLLQYRECLSKDLKSKRMPLSPEQIDEIVQILIDRLIFMRSVEDRGLEGKDFLLTIVNHIQKGQTDKNLWALLKEQFERFDKTYNSKLFASGLLEEAGFFDEQTLISVIKGLYHGTKDHQERYMFDEIPGDLLGNIYEQYLGTILSGTEKRVSLKSGTGKRKRMGIYYTPSYIVDYIVKNTVGEYIQTKSIDEILEVKIVDPACGSGSFLVRAFEEVCSVVENKLKKKEKVKTLSFQSYRDRLSLGQKATILQSCIYGVDLDEKAIELAQLNLLLKLLEDETRETRKRILPNLKDNIKNGNSLIDDPKIAGDKAFNWDAQFRFKFDIVIGNPPYVRVDSLKKEEKEYWKKNFKSSKGKYDLYYLFIEGIFNWVKEKGLAGYIVPNKFCAADSGLSLREIIFSNSEFCNFISVSHLDIFKEASNYPVILILKKGNNLEKINVWMVEEEVKLLEGVFQGYQIKQELEILPSKIIPINIGQPDFNLAIRLLRGSVRLVEYLKISEGLRIPPKLEGEGKSDFEIVKQFQFGRYTQIKRGSYISRKNLESVTSSNSERFINILKDKLVIAEDSLNISASIDNDKRIPQGGVYFGVLINKKISLEYLLGLLNSKLLSFIYGVLFGGMHMGGGYLRYRTKFLNELPIKLPTPEKEKKIVELVNQMLELQKKAHDEKILGREKERTEEQIKQVDWQIDQEVYKFYGITPEEIKIVEKGLR